MRREISLSHYNPQPEHLDTLSLEEIAIGQKVGRDIKEESKRQDKQNKQNKQDKQDKKVAEVVEEIKTDTIEKEEKVEEVTSLVLVDKDETISKAKVTTKSKK